QSVGGLGVFYWEPESYSWMGYNLGAWDPATKEPTVAMDAFLGIRATSVKPLGTVLGYRLNVYPNPFNPSTTIDYDLPKASRITIVIYNLLGEEVARPVDRFDYSGRHSVTWSPENAASGVYICRLESSGHEETAKLILMK
ncbi:MAG TPA: T9SS type A sorting domain-containing protein, partial [Bacteroidota bacterium]|nr:T9SS type A sorting domain-containing protein [Bacteroidota bacterium]